MISIAVTTGLQWHWIVLALVLPLAGGLLLAWPIWLSGQSMLGNLAGSVVMFGAAIGFIMREHAALDLAVQACIDAGSTCWPEPAAFTRFAVYAFIGLAQVIALFSLSVRVEDRRRRRGYAPEWR